MHRKRLFCFIIGSKKAMHQSWEDTPKLQSCLSENLQICVSVNNLSHQAQVTLTREHQVAVQQSYSSIVKKSRFTSINLSLEEFENLRCFLPVFDNFYQYHLYVSNKSLGARGCVARTTAAAEAAATRSESNSHKETLC